MHLGDGGVIVLEKQLNTSQTTNSHLEKKIQTQVHSMKNSAKNQKLLIQKYEILKQKYTPLLASNEKSHEELLVWKDNTIHLQHDVDRLNSQLLTLQHDKEVAEKNYATSTTACVELEKQLKTTVEENQQV